MSERLRLPERAEVALACAALALAAVGLTLLPLTSSVFVRTLVSVVHAEDLTGLGASATLQAAEDVRYFVLHRDAPALPAVIDGRPAFDQGAVSHLADVRDVLLPARSLALAATLFASVWLVWRRRRQRLIASALAASGWALGVLLALAGLVGIADFDAFFTWFHGLFFKPGTWMFPADALLIQIFPLPFWTDAAAAWGVLLVMATAFLFSFAHRLRFTGTTDSV